MDDSINDLWWWPKASEAVGGTLLSHEVYKYQCRECGENHTTKEGSPEFCYRDFDGTNHEQRFEKHIKEEGMEEKQKITGSYTEKGYIITVTQDYSQEFDMGHYRYVIRDQNHHIVRATESVGGVLRGKIDEAWMREELRYFIKRIRRWGE